MQRKAALVIKNFFKALNEYVISVINHHICVLRISSEEYARWARKSSRASKIINCIFHRGAKKDCTYPDRPWVGD